MDATMRVSSASAAVLGMKDVKMHAKPTTIYLMNTGGCEYSCGFCAQGKQASSKEDKLSRVTWPEYSTDKVLDTLAEKQGEYKRICMQVVNTKNIFKTLPKTVEVLRAKAPNAKLAMTIRTYNIADVDAMFAAGVSEVGLSIDAIDPEQFKKIKGGSFEAHKAFVLKAADKYPGKIATHLIVGMGETEKQVVELMEELHAHKIIIAMFAFTPVKGARMEFSTPPDINSYRRIQVALHLIRNNLPHRFGYDEKGQLNAYGHSNDGLMAMLKGSNVFETSGCSD
ncbi:MAG: radical SAM protein, partial [Candidatus Diapherotrites archaeon]|nr:radical SAM protein [Candidatus Diapherotrites archaeon]